MYTVDRVRVIMVPSLLVSHVNRQRRVESRQELLRNSLGGYSCGHRQRTGLFPWVGEAAVLQETTLGFFLLQCRGWGRSLHLRGSYSLVADPRRQKFASSMQVASRAPGSGCRAPSQLGWSGAAECGGSGCRGGAGQAEEGTKAGGGLGQSLRTPGQQLRATAMLRTTRAPSSGSSSPSSASSVAAAAASRSSSKSH